MTDEPQIHAPAPTGPPSSGRGLFISLAAIALVLAVAGGFTVATRQSELRGLAKETEAQSVPTVAVIHPIAEAAQDDLVLPGTLQANVDAPIYARTSGYLLKWYRDIGSRVRQGELLAEIDTPEVDQEMAQAQATRDQIAANTLLAKSSADRWLALRATDAVSQQEVDERKSAYAQLQASLAAADANVKRLEQLESFKHIYAPFAGVITHRNVDVGTLVNAGNGGSQQQLFHLAQTDPIRVYVTVEEINAAAVRAGLRAYLELSQYPGERFDGQIVRTAESIDPATRTLLTEVDVPNPQGRLLPGGYAQVHLQVKAQTIRLQVPVNALLFRAEGLRAVVVDASQHVHLRALTIGRDYGTALEVLQGLSADDWIVLNPADSLEDGEQVRVQHAEIPGDLPPDAGTGSAGRGGSPPGPPPPAGVKK
jgi:multidrug efflux system membrane fusion protein